jgi:hypothetical protein
VLRSGGGGGRGKPDDHGGGTGDKRIHENRSEGEIGFSATLHEYAGANDFASGATDFRGEIVSVHRSSEGKTARKSGFQREKRRFPYCNCGGVS